MNITVEELQRIAADLALENYVLRMRIAQAEQLIAELQAREDNPQPSAPG